jgi:hypothetical protein
MDDRLQVRWVSAFIDVPADMLSRSADFWTALTGSTVGAPVGEGEEFLPLEPRDGDPCLWLQRTSCGGPGCHLDLYPRDVEAAAAAAADLGATRTRSTDGLVVMDSPGGMPFCLVTHRGQHLRPGPAGPPGAAVVVDQICLDIPPSRYDDECDFWARLTGWPRRDGPSADRDEFDRLRRPADIPYAVLLQRLADDEQPRVSGHLDLACEDREAAVAAQVALGAEEVRRTEGWTVMRDPAGMTYCNTTRHPGSV